MLQNYTVSSSGTSPGSRKSGEIIPVSVDPPFARNIIDGNMKTKALIEPTAGEIRLKLHLAEVHCIYRILVFAENRVATFRCSPKKGECLCEDRCWGEEVKVRTSGERVDPPDREPCKISGDTILLKDSQGFQLTILEITILGPGSGLFQQSRFVSAVTWSRLSLVINELPFVSYITSSFKCHL